MYPLFCEPVQILRGLFLYLMDVTFYFKILSVISIRIYFEKNLTPFIHENPKLNQFPGYLVYYGKYGEGVWI